MIGLVLQTVSIICLILGLFQTRLPVAAVAGLRAIREFKGLGGFKELLVHKDLKV